MVEHVKDLCNECHDLHLIWIGAILQHLLQPLLESRQETFSQLVEEVSLGVHLELEGSHQLFERLEANELLALGLEKVLDLGQAVLPEAGGKVGLSDVVQDVFELGAKNVKK